MFRSEYKRRANFQGIRMFAGGAAQHLALAQRVDNTRRFTRSGGFSTGRDADQHEVDHGEHSRYQGQLAEGDA